MTTIIQHASTLFYANEFHIHDAIIIFYTVDKMPERNLLSSTNLGECMPQFRHLGVLEFVALDVRLQALSEILPTQESAQQSEHRQALVVGYRVK